MLTPTHIYVNKLLPILRGCHGDHVRGCAHITGGGLIENIPRVLPRDVVAELDALKWEIPKTFSWLQSEGNIDESKNCLDLCFCF